MASQVLQEVFTSTSLSIGTTVVTITRTPTDPTPSTGTAFPWLPTLGTINPSGDQTSALATVVEVLTSTYTSTHVYTGISVNTITISLLEDPASPGIDSSVTNESPLPTRTTSSNSSGVVATITIPSIFLSSSPHLSSSQPTDTLPTTLSTTSNRSAGSDVAEPQKRDINHSLEHILPAILIPVTFVVIALYFALRRHRRNLSQEHPDPTPFLAITTTSASSGLERNILARAGKLGRKPTQARVDGPTTTLVDQHGSIPCEPNGASGVPDQPVPHSLPPLPSSLLEPTLTVPAIQAEILDIQARLADIECRQPPPPPPQYSSYVDH